MKTTLTISGGIAAVIGLAILAIITPRASESEPNVTPPVSVSERVSAADNLPFLTSAATVVVHGMIVSIGDAVGTVGGATLYYHTATLKPIEFFKGPVSGSTIEIRSLGGTVAHQKGVFYSSEVPFTKGEEVVVFLVWLGKDENLYLSPVAATRGKFSIVPNSPQGRVVIRGDELSFWQDRKELPRLPESRPLSADAFIEHVRELTKQKQ